MIDDLSFLPIHPENHPSKQLKSFIDIGKLLNYEWENGVFQGICEEGFLYVKFLSESIARIVMNPHANKIHTNKELINLHTDTDRLRCVENTETLIMESPQMKIEINKDPVRLTFLRKDDEIIVREQNIGMGIKNGKEVICYKEMSHDDEFYGFGERTGYLNKRGERLTMWNSDVFAPHNPETDALYQSIPFFITLKKGVAHGIFFDNPGKTVFDFKSKETEYSFHGETGLLDYYCFAGPTMKQVINQYTSLTGRMPMPPKWALGYHQSRYSYETEEEVLELVEKFKEKEIPLDAVYLDIHYMDGYRVFTFDKTNFTHPQKLVESVLKQGVHVVPIVDPGVKADPEYALFKEGIVNNFFCKYLDGRTYYDHVWPGKSAFPDFTKSNVRNWWGDKHKFYTVIGIEGIWNDMNEPAVFNETKTMDVEVLHRYDGQLKTHRELHNLYGLFMSKSTYEGLKKQLNGKRPFLLTRAGFAGIQKYAAVWTGDNRSFWEHLHMSLPMVMNLGLSGVPFSGTDVGGFGHDTNGELLARWMQVGAFTPFFRNHSAIGTIRQEPWSFGKGIEEIIIKYIKFRYKWLPHLYSLFAEAHETGLPIMRPLVLEYPEDQQTYNLSDQFMIGENVLVAPIMQPGVEARAVYFPEGRWVNYWNHEVLEGKQYHLVFAELDILPIFVKEGTLVVQGVVKQNAMEVDKMLQLHLYYGENTEFEFTLYDDDGSTFSYENKDYLKLNIVVTCEKNVVHLKVKKAGKFQPVWKMVKLIVHNQKAPISVTENNVKLEPDEKGRFNFI